MQSAGRKHFQYSKHTRPSATHHGGPLDTEAVDEAEQQEAGGRQHPHLGEKYGVVWTARTYRREIWNIMWSPKKKG